jgi:hypothetical protein
MVHFGQRELNRPIELEVPTKHTHAHLKRPFLKRIGGTRDYLTLRSVLSLNNNPQNSSEMKFCENIKFTC